MAVGTYQGVAGLAPRLFALEEETGSHHGHGHVHRTPLRRRHGAPVCRSNPAAAPEMFTKEVQLGDVTPSAAIDGASSSDGRASRPPKRRSCLCRGFCGLARSRSCLCCSPLCSLATLVGLFLLFLWCFFPFICNQGECVGSCHALTHARVVHSFRPQFSRYSTLACLE